MHGAVADADGARLELEVYGRGATAGSPPASVNTSRRRASITGSAPGGAGGQRVEGRHARDRDAQPEREAAGGGQPHPQPR